ncbi:hypothetical protein KUCAC02_000766 [Chaenocephalus aceratus]|uniref:Uncharacterized protein n=1 Tax=Chaenocephalus aceratus TaxID=36190 RepID=A0ACB9W6J7_CHAAC|nr:hypothetical protein KUCAC02_000766 [Chaenocephalus aceratus]
MGKGKLKERLRDQLEFIQVGLLQPLGLGPAVLKPDLDLGLCEAEEGAGELRSLCDGQGLTHLLLLKFVSELLAARGDEMLPELQEEGEEEGGVREEVMRRQLPLSHRERKVGCRNFFWKTFTSC